MFFTVSLYSIFSVGSRDYNIHIQFFTVHSESIFYYFKWKNITTIYVPLPSLLYIVVAFYIIYLHTSKTSSENVINFAFNHQTYFKELNRRDCSIYPDGYHFFCSSSIPNVPGFFLVTFPFYLKHFF